jgi:hypothetical protein
LSESTEQTNAEATEEQVEAVAEESAEQADATAEAQEADVVEAADSDEQPEEVEASAEGEEADEEPEGVVKKFDNPNLKWYIVNVRTSCESTAKASIEERARSKGMEKHFGNILVPAENVVELVKGKKATRSKKFFPGYIFVQMEMVDEAWHLVKNASKVTGFVGGGARPPEVPESQVTQVTQQMETGVEKRFQKSSSLWANQ